MEPSTYPCPACGAPADLRVGCSGCRRPPYPPAAEVIRLDREIVTLGREVERVHRTYQDLAGRLAATRDSRARWAARVRAEVPAPAGPHPVPAPHHPVPAPRHPVPGSAVPPLPTGRPVPAVTAGPPGAVAHPVPAGQPVRPGVPPTGWRPPAVAPPTRPAGEETSDRAVRALLFALGGLLLGTAAVVFTAVAWATVGVAGRALILAAVTVVVLALPLVAARRGLRGTAETLAAVGLLLVLLDGYAIWMVDLFGVSAWPGTRYAALVGGACAALAAGYGRLSRLTGPWLWAWLTVQPVLPLLAVEADLSATGWTLVLIGVALINLAVLGVLHHRRATAPAGGVRLVGQICAWIGHAMAVLVAAGFALVPFAKGEAFGVPVLAGLPLLLAVTVLFGTARTLGSRGLAVTAAAMAVPVSVAAIVRAFGQQWPTLTLLAVGVLAVATAGVVRLLPQRWRTGPWIGALVVAVGTALPAVVLTMVFASMTVSRSLPAWRGADPGPLLTWGWQLPVLVLLAAAAVTLVVPRTGWWVSVVPAVTLGILAAPAAWRASWPAVVALGLLGAVALLVAAVVRPGTRHRMVLPPAVGGTILIGHALLVSFARPLGMIVALTVTASAALVVAVLGRRGSTVQRIVGGVGLGVALATAALTAPLLALVAGAPSWWQARALLAAAALTVLLPYAVRRWWPESTRYAEAGYAVVVGSAGLAAVMTTSDEPVPLYAALGVLLVLVAAPDRRPGVALWIPGGLLLTVGVLAALPATLVALLAPYRPIPGIWSGVPTQTVSGSPGTGAALLVLALAAALVTRGARTRAATAAPFLVAAVPVLLVAVGAPWPVVPAVLLLVGTAALLVSTVGRPYPVVVGVALPTGVVTLGAGVAGLLATRLGTLGATGTLLLAALAIGVAARHPAVRLTGWPVAVASALGFALTASSAGGLLPRTAAFAVLAVAVSTLVAAAVLVRRQPTSSRVLEILAQVVAGVAVLFAFGAIRHAAVVCVLWGTAVAVRLLLGESTGRRRVLAGIAWTSQVVGAWLMLLAGEVALLEAYTVPAAVLALVAGATVLRRRPELTSWLALGPGLAALLLPSLVSVLAAADPQPWRRLLVGVVALTAVLVGAARRWQAPVVLGTVGLTLSALHETLRGWDLLPRWIYLGLGGIVLISVAATYERRRRDLARLRSAVGRMT
ncbi:SCO7613 C-terminal domain-containing membrane protein [Micromonospora sp. SH-82]|uniref:SCO7613 C-terminal domain-containing membrane protein n=1 Tax=Micromonospora sp. SH-82 TaxID=3132938 RepID=UPI003EBCC30D